MVKWDIVKSIASTNAEIAISGSLQVKPSDANERDFAPFNILIIFNNSGKDGSIDLNGDSNRRWPLPNQAILEIPATYGERFNNFTINNNDGAAVMAAGSVRYTYKKAVDLENGERPNAL